MLEKSQKSNERPNFLGNNAASVIEKARFCTNFLLLENCAKYCLDPEPEPKIGTGTTSNHCGSTTLLTSAICHYRIVNIATQWTANS
jgi:hypothetical protein